MLTNKKAYWILLVVFGSTFQILNAQPISTVCALSCKLTSIPIGTSLHSFVRAASSSPTSMNGGAPLPIELIHFHAFKEKHFARLKWATASEVNTRGYKVLRSKNGTDWENIGYREAAGNSTKVRSYQFLDKSPYEGNNYYRVKLINNDGKNEFLPIKMVHFSSPINAPISVYPNPAQNFINISKIKGKGMIYNLAGQMIFAVDLQEDGINTINLQGLETGIYQLILQKADGTYFMERFSKLSLE